MKSPSKGKPHTDKDRPTLLLLSRVETAWLDDTTHRLKRSHRLTSRSKLMRLGIHLLRELSDAELLERLHDLS